MMFGYGFRRVACSVLAATALSAVSSFAVTSQFRGVNWADKRDNFVSGVLVLSGMSLSDNYQSASVVADRVIGQFQELFGTNSVRIPVNEPTILTFWDTYTGVIDMGLSKGRVVMGYWGPAQPSGPKNMNDWWSMWAKIVEKYGDHPNAYFEIFNEPHMYSKTELRDLYAQWLSKFPNVPRDHILLDGSGLAWNVPDIADDPRFEGCLFAVHEYTFWNMSITTEQGWKNSFKGKVGKYADRTVCTEWGGAMSPGEKNGVHYDYMDYNANPTNYFMAYIRGMSAQLREWEMGSFYWPGLRDGDWYSMTKRTGEGANIKLEIVNQSGVDRMKMAWADTVETTPLVREAYNGEPAAIPGVIEAENYDKGQGRNLPRRCRRCRYPRWRHLQRLCLQGLCRRVHGSGRVARIQREGRHEWQVCNSRERGDGLRDLENPAVCRWRGDWRYGDFREGRYHMECVQGSRCRCREPYCGRTHPEACHCG